jgi:aspartyl-tRNA(Asn)/glutamyl-tRNA(Gln) amidotransferase subunit A
MIMSDFPLTIKDTQSGLIKKEYSAVELIDSYLERINKYNNDLNIFLTVSEELAYQKAKEIDEILKSSVDPTKEHPLLGTVVAHKDIFSTKGIRTTAGSKVLKDYIPAYSATVVDRIDKAGAITVGKVNCDAWAHGSSGENSDFGPTKNPWNKEFVSGGSSSGSGASVSANMSLFATASDTCGSTRLPANYNFAYGFKPTYGVTSRYGVVAMASSLDSIGHIARTAEDVEIVFNASKGEDGRDSTLIDIDKYKVAKKEKIKIGVPKEFFAEGLEKEVKKNIQLAIKIFEKQGFEIVDISLPLTKYAISVYYIVQPAEVSSNLGRYDGIRFGNARDFFGDEAKRRIMLGSYVLSAGYYDAYYLKAMKVRSKIIAEVNKTFENVDAIIAPVATTPPFKLGEKTDDPLKMYLTDIYAATANLSGIPSLAVPFEFTQKGLPLGFQLMGPRFSDYNLFELAKVFERATDYRPKVALN